MTDTPLDFEAIEVLKHSIKLFETEGWMTGKLRTTEEMNEKRREAFERAGIVFAPEPVGYCAMGAVHAAIGGEFDEEGVCSVGPDGKTNNDAYRPEPGSAADRALDALVATMPIRPLLPPMAGSRDIKLYRTNDNLGSKDRAVGWFKSAISHLGGA